MVGDFYLEAAGGQVYVDHVAILDKPYGTTLRRLRRHVPYAKAASAAAEAPVRDEGGGGAQFGGAFDHAGQREHLPHARPAFRPFLPHNDYVAWLDAPVYDRVCGIF